MVWKSYILSAFIFSFYFNISFIAIKNCQHAIVKYSHLQQQLIAGFALKIQVSSKFHLLQKTVWCGLHGSRGICTEPVKPWVLNMHESHRENEWAHDFAPGLMRRQRYEINIGRIYWIFEQKSSGFTLHHVTWAVPFIIRTHTQCDPARLQCQHSAYLISCCWARPLAGADGCRLLQTAISTIKLHWEGRGRS